MIQFILLPIMAQVLGMAEYEQKINYYNKGHTTATGEAFRKDSFTCAVANRSMLHAWYRFDCGDRVVYAYANDIIGPAGRKKGHKYELAEGAFRRLLPKGVDPYVVGELTVTVTRAK
jgi:hypothetical protein